jgi:hypothetical protein
MAGELIDLVNQVQHAIGVAPQSVTATGTFTAVSMSQAKCPIGMDILIGSVSISVTQMNIQLQEASTQSAVYTAISGMSVSITSGLANTTGVISLKGMRQQPWVQVNITTLSGVAASGAFLAVEILEQLQFTGGAADIGGYSRSPSA